MDMRHGYCGSWTHEEGAYLMREFHIDDFPEKWLFDLDHMDDWTDWHCARQDMFAEVLAMARECGCVGIWNGTARWYYVHPSTWRRTLRVTCWDAMGPIGHNEVASADALAMEAGWNTFTKNRREKPLALAMGRKAPFQ